MKPDLARQFLAESLDELSQARRHLDYSFQQVAGVPADLNGADASQLESVEAFSSRFARTVDLLLNKTKNLTVNVSHSGLEIRASPSQPNR